MKPVAELVDMRIGRSVRKSRLSGPAIRCSMSRISGPRCANIGCTMACSTSGCTSVGPGRKKRPNS